MITVPSSEPPPDGPRPGEAGALEAGERSRPHAGLPDLLDRRPPLHLLGADVTGKSLESIQPGEGARSKRMGQQPLRRTIVDLALSPDGQYVFLSARDKE
jgi:hypothetical protein